MNTAETIQRVKEDQNTEQNIVAPKRNKNLGALFSTFSTKYVGNYFTEHF